MASFFDDIGKVFSNAGQKTKNMADAAKLNSTLSEEERKLNSIYAQIGQTYIQLHFEDYEEPFEPLIQSYVESRKRIDDMSKKIKELKNIISCPGCGADMSGDAAFCSLCGYRMPPKAASQGPIPCMSCGTPITPGMKFCTTCGAPAPVPAPMQPPVQPVAAACTNCNSPLEPGSAFCVVCGTPVSAPVNAPVPSPAVAPIPAPAPMDIPAPMPAPEAVQTPADIPVPVVEPAPVEAPAAANVCPNCGTTVTEDSMFCIECGTKVR